MRIADKMNYDQVNSGLQKNRTEMSNLQNQAATQKRINKPSDDPLATTRVLSARTDINASQQFLKNINQAKTFLDYADQSLGELTDVLTRAKELAISQSSDASASESTRQVTATEIRQLFGQMVQVGNRQVGDRFLFGGFQTTNSPFSAEGDYRGDDGEMRISVNKEAQVGMNIPGSRVFLGKNWHTSHRSDESNGRNWDAQPAGSEQQSPQPRRMNPGEPGQDLEVRGPAGRDLRDTRASREGADPREGLSNLSSTWRNNGTNLFTVMSDLEVSLRANSKAGVQESLERLDEAITQVVLARSEVGSRVSTLNSATENLTKGVVDSKALASSLEDVDTFELVTDLNKSETTLKASLASSSKLIQPSLLDFLR